MKIYSDLQQLRDTNAARQYRMNGKIVKARSACFLADLFTWQGALIRDLNHLWYKPYLRWCSRATKIEVVEFGKMLNSCIAILRHIPGSNEPFSAVISKLRTLPYFGFIKVVMGEIQQLYLDPTPERFYKLNNYFAFLSRANLPWEEYPSVEEEYCEFEEFLKGLSYPDVLVSKVEQVVYEWFGNYQPKCHGSHSRGATAELTRQTATMQRKEQYLIAPYWISMLPGMDVEQFRYVSNRKIPRCSVYGEQPKTLCKKRIVSAEPTILQFLQHGYRDDLVRYCTHVPILREMVDLTDQEANRLLAKQGSNLGHYGTIDLSSASDSVTVTLVKKLFRRCPALLTVLLITRAKEIRLGRKSSKVIKLEKYAAMGSALCFIIECIVFAAICEAARRDSNSVKLSKVYGDDMVVPTEYTDRVISYLKALHFIVNEDKSFVNTLRLTFKRPGTRLALFREACGGEYLNGVDVAPLRVSRQCEGFIPSLDCKPAKTTPENLSSIISLINHANEHGMFELRSYLIEEFRRQYGREVLDRYRNNWPDGTSIIGYDEWEHPRRWNSDLQHWERRLLVSKPIYPGNAAGNPIDELSDEGLQAYLRVCEDREKSHTRLLEIIPSRPGHSSTVSATLVAPNSKLSPEKFRNTWTWVECGQELAAYDLA